MSCFVVDLNLMGDKMIDLIAVKRIRAILKEADEMGITDKEIMLDIKDVVPAEVVEVEKIVEVEKEPVSSEERLEYMRIYRLEQKQLKRASDKEEKERIKIAKQLKRTSFFCYKCKERVNIINPEESRSSFKRKPNRNRDNIIITNNCPKCKGEIKLFGGYR